MTAHIEKLLSAKRCLLWPDCACNKTLAHWETKLAEDRSWELEHLAWCETSIFLALSCVAEHCPVRRIRAYAQGQLLNSWWDRQRAGIGLTEEFCKRRAQQ
jgi:hypothetical protein